MATKTQWRRAIGAACVVAILACGTAAAGPCCAGDLNGDGVVGAPDLALLLGGWGACPPPCPADLDGGGSVGAGDLALLLGAWGPCPVFEFPPAAANPEAEQIALETLGASGPLLAPAMLYARVDRDLGLIRAHTPALATEEHSPEWAPNQLIVKVLLGQPRTEYDCLNSFYQMTTSEFLFTSGGGDWYVLTFAGNLNVEALGQIYAATPEVEFADPNGFFGGQNFWRPTDQGGGVFGWIIDDGFHDCFDGCDCHNEYSFETDGPGAVMLLSHIQFGQPWCDFGKPK